MKNGLLEHVNVTVADAKKTADMLIKLFDWKIRWQGPSMNDGFTVHVGTDDMYVALYTPKQLDGGECCKSDRRASLNHIGIQVEDLNAVEARVIKAGYKPYNHGTYDPGKRFYFDDENDIEFEVVSYA